MPQKLAILAFFLVLISRVTLAVPEDAGTQFFESKIRPLLIEKCYSCHSAQAKKLKGGLYLDTHEKALKGGESGAAFVPGSPEKSRLIEAIGYKNEDLQMPPDSRLKENEIADLTAWVKMGAPWGKDISSAGVARIEEFNLQKRKAAHWLWKPVTPQTPPAVKNALWPRSDIDRFILAALEENHLSPAQPADRRTLIRRVYFDLTGLAPKPEEVEAFVSDSSPDAFAKVVDRLLASPQFGERWGRHWMDLVRFAETMGHEFDFPIANAWRYRDYIVRAFNADLPYNQLITEHVAGDLLANPRRTPDGNNESILATGFWFMGEGVQSPVDVKQYQADVFDNRIDVFGKTFLGVTVACARCHDHKFDAISTADYYALYGYMKGTRYTQRAINDRAIASAAEQLKPAHEKLRQAIAEHWLIRLDRLTVKELATAADTPLKPGDIDLAADAMSAWQSDGPGLIHSSAGDFVTGDEKRPVTAFIVPAGISSATVSRKLQGNLRSPDFQIDKRYLHVRVQGAGARLSIIVENFNVIRDPIYGRLKHSIKSDKPAWISVDLKMWEGRQAYLEFSNITVADPAGPASPENAWFAVDRALLSNDARHPVSPEKPTSVLPLLRQTIELWRDGKLAQSTDATLRVSLLNQAIQKGLLDGVSPKVTALLKEYHHLEQAIPAPAFALAAADGVAGNEHIFIRGNYKIPGPAVPRRLLEAVCGQDQPAPPPSGSGRLELAQRIADPNNPLTARVYVNRIWHHLLGRGIVASTDNFGKLGEAPSNQPLLDYLADHFTSDDHWSTKTLIRKIVLSSVYQMASKSDEASDQADPDNKLLHRANIKRLEAEAIRDHLLQVAGALKLTIGGPSIPVHLTPFMEGRGRPGGSGPLDGAGRRSIYIETRRNFLTPMLLAFDQPLPFNSMGRRSISNVPAQALILMNDPFVLEESKLWAKRTLAQAGLSSEQRLQQMYEAAFSRPPAPDEIGTILDFANQQGEQLAIPREKRLQDIRVWTDIAQALINTKEFIFIE
jgi:cytochrome c553